MRLEDALVVSLRLVVILVVTLSLFLYTGATLMSVTFPYPINTHVAFLVTFLLVVSLVMVATRAEFAAAAALIAATIVVSLSGGNPYALPYALVASLAPLLGVGMISYATRRARST